MPLWGTHTLAGWTGHPTGQLTFQNHLVAVQAIEGGVNIVVLRTSTPIA